MGDPTPFQLRICTFFVLKCIQKVLKIKYFYYEDMEEEISTHCPLREATKKGYYLN